jgi:hypothetical protein
MAALPLREEDAGWYLYGVVPSGAEVPGATAVDPRHEVVALREGPVAALASRVSLDEFDEAVLPERLADAEWLEEKIRSHEQVLESALATAAVVPCRFCTVYRDESALRRFLSERAAALSGALARVEGRVELGVKAFAATHASGEEASRAESGRAYLEARRRERQAREELGQARAQLAGELHERLRGAAEDGVLLDLQSRDVSGRDADMIFNGAYLVAEGARFREALAAAARDHGEIDLELTGPWPPYNFVPAELASP